MLCNSCALGYVNDEWSDGKKPKLDGYIVVEMDKPDESAYDKTCDNCHEKGNVPFYEYETGKKGKDGHWFFR